MSDAALAALPEPEAVPFRWRDGRGTWRDATGLLFLPPAGHAGPRPLVYYAGYEATPELVAGWRIAGAAVVATRTPGEGESWPHWAPIPRGPEMDLALLRTVRADPRVDDAHVVVTGASAGGYMTMMVTAATFPLNGSFPVVPPIDLSYNMACFFHDPAITKPRGDGQTVMAHTGEANMQAMGRAVLEHHGPIEGARVRAYSPIAHLERITCPVVSWSTSADALVPIPQIGGPLAAKAIAAAPEVYPIDPGVVCPGLPFVSLLDALPDDEVQYEELTVPDGTARLDIAAQPTGPGAVLQAPAKTKRWLVMVIDEGGPDPDVGHFRHAVAVDTTALLAQLALSTLPAEQLTMPKLVQLADRAAGRGWLVPGDDAHASDPEVLDAERRDVARGLATYAAASPEHRARLDTLVAALDAARRGELAAYLPA
jgi:hypothetical protein